MLNITAARKARQNQVELNITPLIDMVFILLIFFLVTTSFVKESGVDINRPRAATAESKLKTSLLIGITRDNRVYIDRREVDARRVKLVVEGLLLENPEMNVLIAADRESATGSVIEVMDACKLAGAEQLALAAQLPAE